MKLPKTRLLIRWALVAAILVVVVLNFNAVASLATRLFGVSIDFAPGALTEPKLPPGFTSAIFAGDLGGPRFMAVAPDGTVYVAEQSNGRVSALKDKDGDGQAEQRVTVAEGLNGPSSLAIVSGTLIVGEHTQVSQLTLGPDGKESGRKALVPDLPNMGVHHTKTVLVGRDGKLYVSVGSSCNVCAEGDARRAAVSVYNQDGTGGRVFARGLRNAVGLELNPWTGEIWATNNGRDLMGDDTPPETVYALKDGEDYGWPRCHAGRILDPQFGGSEGCKGVTAPVLEAQAHMAPLGMAFYKDGPFPPPYRDSLYVAFHGSWNRSTKVGYKVMRAPMKDGQVAGPLEDFMTGFLQDDINATGRPTGIAVARDGSLLVSDDKGGFIYRVAWAGK